MSNKPLLQCTRNYIISIILVGVSFLGTSNKLISNIGIFHTIKFLSLIALALCTELACCHGPNKYLNYKSSLL